MQEDKKKSQELQKSGKITKEQYDSLLIGKITVGLGYNDIKEAIKKDEELVRDDINRLILPRTTSQFPELYTDAGYKPDGKNEGQWIIEQREKLTKHSGEEPHIYEDDIQIYDSTNMDSTLLLTMKRMERAIGKGKLCYVNISDDETEAKSKRLIKGIAREYGIEPEKMKIISANRIVIVYSQEKGKTKISDIFSSPIKENLTEEQKQKAENHIKYQMKKALMQIGIQDVEVNTNNLTEIQAKLIQEIIQEIQDEKVIEK